MGSVLKAIFFKILRFCGMISMTAAIERPLQNIPFCSNSAIASLRAGDRLKF
jgi:hypothetical protein